MAVITRFIPGSNPKRLLVTIVYDEEDTSDNSLLSFGSNYSYKTNYFDLSLRVSPSPCRRGDNVKVSYTLPASDIIELDVYDSQGHLISTLDKGHKEAATYEYYIDTGGGMGLGVYIIQLKTKTATEFQKLTLVD